jgi:hypothetical protein
LEYQTYVVPASGSGPARQALQSIGSLFIQDISSQGSWIVTLHDIRYLIRYRLPGEDSERAFSWLNLSTGSYFSSKGERMLFQDESRTAGANGAVAYGSIESGQVVRLGEGAAQGFSPDDKWALGIIRAAQQLVLYPVGLGEPIRLDRGPI